MGVNSKYKNPEDKRCRFTATLPLLGLCEALEEFRAWQKPAFSSVLTITFEWHQCQTPELQGFLYHIIHPCKIFIQEAWKQPWKGNINHSFPGIWKTKIQTNYRSCPKSCKNSAPVSCTVHAESLLLSFLCLDGKSLAISPLKPKKIPWHTAKEFISKREKRKFASDNCFLDWNILLNKRIFHTGKVWKLSSFSLPSFNQYNPGLTSQAQKMGRFWVFPVPRGVLLLRDE